MEGNKKVAVLAFFKLKASAVKEGEESPIIAATKEMIEETLKVYIPRLAISLSHNTQQGINPLSSLCLLTNKEAGCIKYALHKDLDDPLRYTMIEEWYHV